MLLDTASLYFRAFFGIPDTVTAPDGTPVNAVRGMVDFVNRLVEEYQPTHLACCWDDDWRPQWRVDLLPSYKAHRVVAERASDPDVEEVPDPLQKQVPLIRAVLDAFGIAVVGAPEMEADEVTVEDLQKSAINQEVDGNKTKAKGPKKQQKKLVRGKGVEAMDVDE